MKGRLFSVFGAILVAGILPHALTAETLRLGEFLNARGELEIPAGFSRVIDRGCNESVNDTASDS